MHTAGGRVSIVIRGQPFSARGEISVMTSSIEITAEANQDGSVYRTIKPTPHAAECSFDRFRAATGEYLRWDNGMMLETFPVTFIEDDTGQMHLMTGATFVGRPSLNLATGEVSGVSIASTTYQRVG